MSPLPLTVRGWSYFILSAVVFTLWLLLNFKAYTNFATIDSVEWRFSDFSKCASAWSKRTGGQH